MHTGASIPQKTRTQALSCLVWRRTGPAYFLLNVTSCSVDMSAFPFPIPYFVRRQNPLRAGNLQCGVAQQTNQEANWGSRGEGDWLLGVGGEHGDHTVMARGGQQRGQGPRPRTTEGPTGGWQTDRQTDRQTDTHMHDLSMTILQQFSAKYITMFCHWPLIGSCVRAFDWYKNQRLTLNWPWMVITYSFTLYTYFGAHHWNLNEDRLILSYWLGLAVCTRLSPLHSRVVSRRRNRSSEFSTFNISSH